MKKPLPGGGKDFLLGGCPGSKLEEYCGLTQLKHSWKKHRFLYIQKMHPPSRLLTTQIWSSAQYRHTSLLQHPANGIFCNMLYKPTPTLWRSKTDPRHNIRIKSAILSSAQSLPYYFKYSKLSSQTQRQKRGTQKLLTPVRNLLEMLENITVICPFLFFITDTAR